MALGALGFVLATLLVVLGVVVGSAVVIGAVRLLRWRSGPPRRTPPSAPSEPDRYVVVRTIGAGAHGVVHLARDTLLERDVVIKQLQVRDVAVDARAAVLREARAAAAHPNIVSVYDVIRIGDDDAIVMEYVEGGNLAERLATGPLAPAQAFRIAAGVLAALEALHRRRIVHRDVKPANILLGEGLVPKLSDLGVARLPDAAGPSGPPGQPGTLRYMSPEQAAGLPVGAASDLYSVGAVLYEMLTGRHHLGELPDDPGALRVAIATGAALVPAPGLPVQLDRVMARALQREPGRRFRSARDFRRDLVAVARDLADQPPRGL